MPYKDYATQLAYQNQWMKNRRLQWIASKGGKCVNCGSRENLEVDHIDKDEKVSHRVWSWSSERRSEELAKCQVLCLKCHMEKTAIENGRKGCGTTASYDRGCRCQLCRDAHAASTRAYRLRKKLELQITGL